MSSLALDKLAFFSEKESPGVYWYLGSVFLTFCKPVISYLHIFFYLNIGFSWSVICIIYILYYYWKCEGFIIFFLLMLGCSVFVFGVGGRKTRKCLLLLIVLFGTNKYILISYIAFTPIHKYCHFRSISLISPLLDTPSPSPWCVVSQMKVGDLPEIDPWKSIQGNRSMLVNSGIITWLLIIL